MEAPWQAQGFLLSHSWQRGISFHRCWEPSLLFSGLPVAAMTMDPGFPGLHIEVLSPWPCGSALCNMKDELQTSLPGTCVCVSFVEGPEDCRESTGMLQAGVARGDLQWSPLEGSCSALSPLLPGSLLSPLPLPSWCRLCQKLNGNI